MHFTQGENVFLFHKMRSGFAADRKRYYFNLGVKDTYSSLIATGIWGFVTGIAMMKSELGESFAALMTLTVYAGSAQLTSLPLINNNAPLWLIFVAGMIVNVRFIIFSAALQPFFRHLKWYKRLVLGYITTDMSFVLFMSRYGSDTKRASSQHLWYFLGLVIPNWLVWQFCSYSGIFVGRLVPESWGIEYAAILALLGLLVPLVKTRPFAMCLLVSAIVAWMGQVWPLRLGLGAAVVAGIIAGVVTEQLQRKRET